MPFNHKKILYSASENKVLGVCRKQADLSEMGKFHSCHSCIKSYLISFGGLFLPPLNLQRSNKAKEKSGRSVCSV